MRLKSVSLCLALCVSASSLLAEPITVLGVNWADKNVFETLGARGYKCRKVEGQGLIPHSRCDDGNKEIIIWERYIQFSCQTYGGCSYKLEEVARFIVDSGIISSLDYEKWADVLWEWDAYCGRGEDGDRICVRSRGSATNIVLEKGSFGAGGMSLD